MNNTIDWTNPVLLSAPRAAKPDRRETHYRCTCLTCGNVRWLRRSDAAKDRPCALCQRREAGKRGYAATVRRKGPDFALEAIRQRELEQPSRPERRVLDWLTGWGLAFERQVAFALDPEHQVLIDFVIADLVAVEVNGYWHDQTRQERDRRLRAAWPGKVVFVDSSLIEKYPTVVAERLRHDIRCACIELLRREPA